ncbi:ABC transporter substrate-binding protein [Paenibacillus campi]|uniref:ABC transporter substrate-binding protein n=1 Tax=Paenibacillus campi TaxID=3106031 RepID=UPI002AFDCFF7|nr:ABC transporter substrate-binding protein [Paenibacillus sp. SGZ-1014]
MRVKWLWSGILLWIAAIVFAGCNSDNTSWNGESKHSSGNVLTIGTASSIESFDPHNNNNTSSEAILVNMFDYLLKNDSNQRKIPVLATSWQQTDDNIWRFHLRHGVTFQNGDPFTSADVKFTLDRVAKDTTLRQNRYFNKIIEVRIIDDYTVDIVTDGPDPLLLNRLSKIGAGMLPSAYIATEGMDAFLQKPIGTGPYAFGQWLKNDRVELVRNDHYFGGKPKWDRVVFCELPNTATRVAELLAGHIDIATDIPARDIKRIEHMAGKTIVKAPIQRVLQIILRTASGNATANPKVRAAIDFAIDKQKLVDSVAGGAGVVTRTSVTPGNFGADPGLYGHSLYDPQRAKRLLQEAGYRSGGPAIQLSVSSAYEQYAQMVTAMLDQVGFQTTLEVLEPNAFNKRYSSRSFKEAFMIGIGNSLFDASNNFTRYLKAIAVGETDYNNPKVEQLLQAAAINLNPITRDKQYEQVQQILAQDRPAIYLFQMEGVYGVDQRIIFAPRRDEMFYADDIVLASSSQVSNAQNE